MFKMVITSQIKFKVPNKKMFMKYNSFYYILHSPAYFY